MAMFSHNQMVPFHDGDWYAKFGGSGANKNLAHDIPPMPVWR